MMAMNPREIKFSLSQVLVFSFLWAFGLFSYLHPASHSANLALSLLLAAFAAASVLFAERFPQMVVFRVDRALLACLFGLLLCFGALTYREILFNVNGDELFHSQYSQVLSLKLLKRLAETRVWLQAYQCKPLIWCADLALLAACVATLRLLRGRRLAIRVAFAFLSCLSFRLLLDALGGNPDGHPTLRLFPLWLGAAVFSPSSFGFHIPQFVALLLFSAVLFQKASGALGPRNAFLFALAAGSLPIVLEVSHIAEPSLWCFIAWCFVLTSLPGALSEPDPKLRFGYYLQFSTVLAIATMMRQPTFLAYIPLGLTMLIRERTKIFSFAWVIFPAVLIVPQTIWQVLVGTPSTKGVTSSSALSGVAEAFATGVMTHSVWNAIFWYGAVLLALAVIPFARKELVVKLIGLTWLALAFVLYFSISRELWGAQRYQAEYVAPFLVFGLYSLAEKLKNRRAASVLLIAIVGLNVGYFLSLPGMNHTSDERKYEPIGMSVVYAEPNFDFEAVYDDIKSQGFAGSSFLAGMGYGNMLGVMHHYTAGELLSELSILNEVLEVKKARNAADLIHLRATDFAQNPKIKAVIWADCIEEEGPEEFLKEMQKAGFQVRKTYNDDRYHGTIRLLTRG